ncbi:MAG TPA: LptF/LptG family permease [Verrucomicrobiales bacterium]|nr:LptF/LptG family permease [Verrucomicrobiales bacterium]
MRILDRYIGLQVFAGSVFAVISLTLVFGLGHVFKTILPRLVDGSLPLELVLRSVLIIIPFSLAYTVPWGLLSAVLLVFGRMSADSEFVAFRMAGLSMKRICAPVFLLAMMATGLCLWLNLDVSPRAKDSLKRVLRQSDVTALFREGEVLSEVPGKLIYVGKSQGRTFRDVEILELQDRGSNVPASYVFAGEMEIESRPEEGLIVLPMRDVQMELKDDEEPRNARRVVHGITFGGVAPDISIRAMLESDKKPDEMTVPELRTKMESREVSWKDRNELGVELARRGSLSLASLTFCLVGIPLAITAHRRETLIGFVFSLGVAFLFFFFIIWGELLGDRGGWLPHALMWMPNVIFPGAGFVLFRRLSRC